MLRFSLVLVASVLIRVVLIIYSDWHDAHSVVKYTDVDYRVFSDAARFILHPGSHNFAKGPLVSWFGDPYTRETYRYTPILALLLAPGNAYIHPSFGKYVFAACDIVNGLIIFSLLSRHKKAATLCASLHLLNPLIFSISTRGSSEAVLGTLVLFTLHCALNHRWDMAAVALGVSTHWKLYPVIYGASCLAIVGQSTNKDQSYLSKIINWRTIRFGSIAAATFFLLGAGCYAIWGYPFLHETYLYHLHRLDHRHNFSPYFYLTYLTYPAQNERPVLSILTSPFVSFGPQMMLALGTGLLFGRNAEDLPFTWFVQTFVFVIFNKVCTSQYFLWYLVLLPLLLPNLKTISPLRAGLYIAVWVGTQGLWLAGGYELEFLGRDVYLTVWKRGLVYLVGNAWVLAGIMHAYIPSYNL